MMQRKMLLSALLLVSAPLIAKSHEPQKNHKVHEVHQMPAVVRKAVMEALEKVECDVACPCDKHHLCENHRYALTVLLHKLGRDMHLDAPELEAYLSPMLRAPLDVDGSFTQYNGDVSINDDSDANALISIGNGAGTAVKDIILGCGVNTSSTYVQSGSVGINLEAHGGDVFIGSGNTTSVTIAEGGVNTTVNGALIVTELFTANTDATVAGILTQSGGDVNINDDTTVGTVNINIGTGSAAGAIKLVTVGSTTDASTTTIQSGGGITIDGGPISIGATTATSSISVGGMGIDTTINGPLIVNDTHTANAGADVFGAFNQSGGEVNINNDTGVDATINIGTGATSSKTIFIGNGANATSIDIEAGSGGAIFDAAGAVSVGAVNATSVAVGASGYETTIGGALIVTELLTAIDGQEFLGNFSQSGGSVNIGADDATSSDINIGTGVSSEKTIVIGNEVGDSSTTILGGNLGVTIDATGPVSLGTTESDSVSIGVSGSNTTVNGNLVVGESLLSYFENNTTRVALKIAAADIPASGVISFSASNNLSYTHTNGTGVYNFTIADMNLIFGCSATLASNTSGTTRLVAVITGANTLTISTFSAGTTAGDVPFSLVVYGN